MTDDFVTELRLQLRDVALQDERRGRVGLGFVRARRSLPGPEPVAAVALAVLLAVAVALGALQLRGEREPEAPKVVGTYRVADGLSSLAPGFGSVWSADPIRGDVLRIDPRTRRVIARIPVGGEARVAAGAGAVWVVAGDLQYGGGEGPVRLLRIDPRTNRVVARIPMRTDTGARFVPADVRIVGGAVWAVGLDGVLRVDPRTDSPGLHIALGTPAGDPRGIVITEHDVWALSASGRLVRYDARDGRAAGAERVRAPVAAYLLAGPSGRLMLLLGRGGLALLDPSDGRLAWRVAAGKDIGWVQGREGELWVQVSAPESGDITRDRLLRLDPETGRRRGAIELPAAGVAGMADVGRELWTATPSGTITVIR